MKLELPSALKLRLKCEFRGRGKNQDRKAFRLCGWLFYGENDYKIKHKSCNFEYENLCNKSH